MQSLLVRFLKFFCHNLTVSTAAKQQPHQIDKRIGGNVAGKVGKQKLEEG